MIYTSCWDNYHKYKELGYDIVSISNTMPDEYKHLKIVTIRDVVPSFDLINLVKFGNSDYEKYIHYYKLQLSKLNPYQVHLDLMDRVAMCYEPFDINLLALRLDGEPFYGSKSKFCHRHILSEWLNNNGYPCEELLRK